jgi:hypothetical protein
MGCPKKGESLQGLVRVSGTLLQELLLGRKSISIYIGFTGTTRMALSRPAIAENQGNAERGVHGRGGLRRDSWSGFSRRRRWIFAGRSAGVREAAEFFSNDRCHA